jgi:hypothetical protein
MATPIVEDIAADVKTALELISIANGYEQDLADVVRPTQFGGYVPQHLMVVLQQSGREREEGSDVEQMNGRAWIQRFEIEAYVRVSDTSTTAVDITVNKLTADIEKALMADAQRSSLAMDSWVSAVEPFLLADAEFEGATVHYDVLFRTEIEDPYTNRI